MADVLAQFVQNLNDKEIVRLMVAAAQKTARNSDERIARARVVQSDLIAALRETRNLLRAFVRPDSDAIARAVFEQGEAAIAKAEGADHDARTDAENRR